MSKRLYISTGWENRALAAQVADVAEGGGWEIAYRWWRYDTKAFLDERERVRIGEEEINAIQSADAVLVILPGGRGTHVELGVALGAGKTTVLVAKPDDLWLGGALCAFHDMVSQKATDVGEGLLLLEGLIGAP